MNTVRITKKGMVLIVVLLVLLSAGVGYGLWRVNSSQQLSGTDTSAGGKGGANCSSCTWSTEQSSTYCPDGTTHRTINVCNQNRECNYYKLCGGTDGRYHCCDGTWALGSSGSAACGNQNYGSNCKTTVKQCTCASYSNCGRDCVFPASVKDHVKQLADTQCTTVMAFCNLDSKGNTTISYGDPGKCDPKVCNNPTDSGNCKPNLCDGGGLIAPANGALYNKGQSVVFKGYAFDTDGINAGTIKVTVDGKPVGTAKAIDACGAGGDATVCNAHKNQKPIVWTYTYVTTGGRHALRASWEDSKGVTGSQCKTVTIINSETIKPPVVLDDWAVSKNGVLSCVNDDPQNPKARVDYTVTVKNSATEAKNITKIVDTLDSKVLPSYILISTINPGATLNGNVITWNLTGADAAFAAGQTKVYKYSILIPKSAFGTYTNTVVVTPAASSAIQVSNTILAKCTSQGKPVDTPQTGIFDSGLARVGLGILLIGFGFAYLYSDSFQKLVANTLGKVTDPILSETAKTDLRRRKFERKVVKK